MIRTVRFHGSLAALHPDPIQIEAKTVAEAIEGITRQIAGFRPRIGQGYRRIRVVGYETVEQLYKTLDDDEIEFDIVPQLNGGKSGGYVQILIGAALVAASFIPGIGTALAPLLLKVGVLMILGGIAQLLAPQPKSDSSAADKSRYLGSPKNTVAIGTRIPILYGRRRVYGHYLSFDINAVEVKGG